jgi:hypothetical protein
MIFVPEKDLGQYLRVKKKRENWFPVVRGSGARIGIYTLSVLNAMWGKGWFSGAVRNGILRLLVLRVPVTQFYWELERITGEVRPTRAEEKRYSRWLFNKYCARCGKEKYRDDFHPYQSTWQTFWAMAVFVGPVWLTAAAAPLLRMRRSDGSAKLTPTALTQRSNGSSSWISAAVAASVAAYRPI